MYCKVYSGTVEGVDGIIISVEADVCDGLPQFDMVGLLASEVKEARERVCVAIRNSGYCLPPKRITINLSPADVRKDGTGFDLPIAVSVLSAMGIIPVDSFESSFIVGELGLDGSVKRVNGILSLVYEASVKGFNKIVVPYDNAKEAAVIKGIEVYGVKTLNEVVEFYNNRTYIESSFVDMDEYFEDDNNEYTLDFGDVMGQAVAKRAIEISVSGMHNLLMIGPPGVGKTMLAQRIPGIMPNLTFEESMSISKIYSVAGMLKDDMGMMKKRPFRCPHHSITTTALVGGGTIPRPGEVSLASKGVLFLDELPEFKRDSLEVLRQPLEDGYVVINRLGGSYRFMADFLLICAMNPCKCGYFPDRNRCRCNANDIKRYLGKISTPLLDRIDMTTQIQEINYEDMDKKSEVEKSSDIRARVKKTHAIQRDRFKNRDILFNSQMSEGDIKKYCTLSEDGRNMIEQAYKAYRFTPRKYHKLLKVARTIADLDGSESINVTHLSEAICFRHIDKQYFGGV